MSANAGRYKAGSLARALAAWQRAERSDGRSRSQARRRGSGRSHPRGHPHGQAPCWRQPPGRARALGAARREPPDAALRDRASRGRGARAGGARRGKPGPGLPRERHGRSPRLPRAARLRGARRARGCPRRAARAAPRARGGGPRARRRAGTDAELAEMRAHVHAQHRLVDQPKAYMESDLAFARLVVRATHNIAFELAFNTVSKAIAGNNALELAYYANAHQTLAVYERLLDFMEKRDSGRIRQVTSRLLERLDRRTLGLLAGLGGVPEDIELDP
ncbi:MAG: FCD domain-containing protein [Sandaracinaceae bacterium]|nr:FCD domain-containing protein [Sandaracinaceae bacterium]